MLINALTRFRRSRTRDSDLLLRLAALSVDLLFPVPFLPLANAHLPSRALSTSTSGDVTPTSNVLETHIWAKSSRAAHHVQCPPKGIYLNVAGLGELPCGGTATAS